jgi:hypothetical protein
VEKPAENAMPGDVSAAWLVLSYPAGKPACCARTSVIACQSSAAWIGLET